MFNTGFGKGLLAAQIVLFGRDLSLKQAFFPLKVSLGQFLSPQSTQKLGLGVG